MQVLSPADRLYSGNSASRSDSLPRETGSFMSALANMTEAEVFFLSPDFVILLANDAAATALGVSRSHLIGHRIDEVLPMLYRRIETFHPELERTGAILFDQGAAEMRQGQLALRRLDQLVHVVSKPRCVALLAVPVAVEVLRVF